MTDDETSPGAGRNYLICACSWSVVHHLPSPGKRDLLQSNQQGSRDNEKSEVVGSTQLLFPAESHVRLL
jgi:hypothetical protein